MRSAEQRGVLRQMIRREFDAERQILAELRQPAQRVGRFDEVVAVVLDGDGEASSPAFAKCGFSSSTKLRLPPS